MLTLLPVLCGASGRIVKEPKVPLTTACARYRRRLQVCLRHRVVTLAESLILFGTSLLLVPFSASGFMPHLDEGAFWVRATMPYTISFDEASNSAPHVRGLLLTSPGHDRRQRVGRPDNGTDPTGSTTTNTSSGLRRFSDPLVAGSIRRAAARRGDSRSWRRCPASSSIDAAAEDAVDKAMTGLKSSLAVKIFGGDLQTLEAKAEAVRKTIAAVPGITNITVVRELGQPSLTMRPDRARESPATGST